MKLKRIVQLLSAAILSSMLCVPAFAAEQFPAKTINIVHGFGPGGGIDILARMAIMKARPALKVPLVVVSMPGGGTVEAMRHI